METVDVVATQPLMIPAGHIQEGEIFSTTESHARELMALGLVKKATKKAVAEAKAEAKKGD